MSDRLHVGTRKGLFEIARRKSGWDVVDAHFLGEPDAPCRRDSGW